MQKHSRMFIQDLINALFQTISRKLKLLADKLYIVGAGMNELEFECAGEALVEGEWSLEAATVHLGGVELCCGTELLDADR